MSGSKFNNPRPVELVKMRSLSGEGRTTKVLFPIYAEENILVRPYPSNHVHPPTTYTAPAPPSSELSLFVIRRTGTT